MRPGRSPWVLLCATVLTAMPAAGAGARPIAAWSWVGSWASSQQIPEPQNALPAARLRDATLRQIVHLSVGGKELRVRLSNACGTAPLTILSVHVARPLSRTTGSIDPATDEALTFAGSPSVTIPAGADYWSDPITFHVRPLADLAVTMYLEVPPQRQTSHPGARETSFLVHGDHVADARLPDAAAIDHWFLLSGVDVRERGRGAAIVTLGDSITDGHATADNTDTRWPDDLARRLQASPATRGLSVLNVGTGGNRLLRYGLGPDALARFDRDVLAQTGVRYLIVLEGINDLGTATRLAPLPAARHTLLVHRIIAAYRQIILRAHQHGITVIGGTITPDVGNGYYHPGAASEADRQAINAWIRQPGHFDAVVDFDRVVRDPSHPDRLLPAYDSGDHLHPSPAGYRAMAAAIPLRLFTGRAACVPKSMAGAAVGEKPRLTFTPFHADGIYALGEEVGWTVTPAPGTAVPRGRFSYTIRSDDLHVVKSGSFDPGSGKAIIETTFDQPAMLYVAVDYQGGSAPTGLAADRVATLGAAVAPTLLKPSVPAPADFDSFWKGELAKLRRIPANPVLTPVPTSQPGVRLFRVRLDSLGSHVHGYLALPDRRGRFPALIIYQWAGVYPLQSAWATDRAAEGWLTLDVDSHDLRPDQGAGVPDDYPKIGDRSRRTSYFLDMYLRDTRALQYIRSSPRWDGRTVVLTGTSMGGQQSLVTAGLNPGKVTAVLVDEPSGADSNGDLHGRRAGYPNWDPSDPRIMRTALYFDTVNFAPRITAATLIAMGFIDTTAPPAGIWTELNEIPAPREAVPLVDSAHNNITPQEQGAWLQRSEEVLATIAHGGRFVPNPVLTRSGSAGGTR